MSGFDDEATEPALSASPGRRFERPMALPLFGMQPLMAPASALGRRVNSLHVLVFAPRPAGCGTMVTSASVGSKMKQGKKLSLGAEMPSILIVSKPLPDGTVKELFVGAATSDRATAELLLEKLEPGPRVASIKSNDAISWPIFILEEPSGFSILGRDDVHASVAKLLERRPPAPRGDDYFLANLYFLNEQFVPKDILRDSMGRIRHAHLSDLALDDLGPRVLDEWLKPPGSNAM